MGGKSRLVIEILLNVLDRGPEPPVSNNDRIALIKFSKKSNRVFSLVQKEKNFTQLKNQIEKLNLGKSGQDANLGKALVNAMSEFRSRGER